MARTRVPRDDNLAEAMATSQVLLSVAQAAEETEAEAAASSAGRGNRHREVNYRTCLRPLFLEGSPCLHCLLHQCLVQIRLRRLVRRLHLQLGVLELAGAETTTMPETGSADAQSLAATTLSDEITEDKDAAEVRVQVGGMAEVNGMAKAAGKVAPVANSSIVSESSDSSRGETVE